MVPQLLATAWLAFSAFMVGYLLGINRAHGRQRDAKARAVRARRPQVIRVSRERRERMGL